MSKFLAYYSPLYDTGGSPAGFKAQFKQHLLDNQWVIIEDLASEMTVRPPASELLGGDLAYSVLRIVFYGSTIVFYPTVVNIAGSKKAFTIWPSDNATVYNGTYVQFGPSSTNRVTFNLPGIGGVNTNSQKAQAIYDALIASSNAEAQKYDYQIINDQNRMTSHLASAHIYVKATAKQPGDAAALDITVAGSGIGTPKAIARGQSAGEIAKFVQTSSTQTYYEMSLPTPYGTGFVYYLSVSSRSLILSVKTTTSIEGPMYAQFIEHDEAVSQTPYGCTPVELFVGRVTSTSAHYYVGESQSFSSALHASNFDLLRPSHFWGVKAGYYTSSTTFHESGYIKSILNDRSTDRIEKIEDISGYVNGVDRFQPIFALGAMIPSPGTSYRNKFMLGAMPFDFSPLYVMGTFIVQNTSYDEQHGVLPDGALPDIFVIARPMNNESLHLAADYQVQTTISSAVSNTDAVINVTSTAAFASAGTLLIGTETVTYTGKTATSFTGVSRARENSVAAAYGQNQPVYAQYWLVVINKLAFRAGYVKPS